MKPGKSRESKKKGMREGRGIILSSGAAEQGSIHNVIRRFRVLISPLCVRGIPVRVLSLGGFPISAPLRLRIIQYQ